MDTLNIDPLNELETSILEVLANENITILSHIPFLRVVRRKKTGVGLYVNFHYLPTAASLKDIEPRNSLLSPNSKQGRLFIGSLKYPLTCLVSIINGRVNQIELVTNGNEAWDGTTSNFHFAKYG